MDTLRLSVNELPPEVVPASKDASDAATLDTTGPAPPAPDAAGPDALASLRMRPRFEGVVDAPAEEVQARLRRAVEAQDRFRGRVYDTSAVLKVSEEERHFWSPQLHLSMEPSGTRTEVLGLFSPHPTVWSAFLAAYLAIAFSGIMGVTIGASQWLLDTTPWALWAGPASIVLTVAVYLAARLGRRLGHGQTLDLYRFVKEALPLTRS